jgi:hypothetical protein
VWYEHRGDDGCIPSSSEVLSCAPSGLVHFALTHGLRRGLYSCAAARLNRPHDSCVFRREWIPRFLVP